MEDKQDCRGKNRREEYIDLLRFEISFKTSLLESLSSWLISMVSITIAFIALYISSYEKIFYFINYYTDNIYILALSVLSPFIFAISPLIIFIIKYRNLNGIKEQYNEIAKMRYVLKEIVSQDLSEKEIRRIMEEELGLLTPLRIKTKAKKSKILK